MRLFTIWLLASRFFVFFWEWNRQISKTNVLNHADFQPVWVQKYTAINMELDNDEVLWLWVVFMMTSSNGKKIPRYWPFVRGIHRSPVNSPHKGQWCGAPMFSLICAWISAWINNREAGDLRRHGTHYYVIVNWLSTPQTWRGGDSPAVRHWVCGD